MPRSFWRAVARFAKANGLWGLRDFAGGRINRRYLSTR